MSKPLAIGLLALSTVASAQIDPPSSVAVVVDPSDSPAINEVSAGRSPHAISAQVLHVDYAATAGGAGAVANGLDIGYHHRLSDYFSLGLPVKVGVVERELELASRNPFASADLTAQLGYPLLGDRLRPYAVAGGGVVVEANEGTNVQIPVGAGLRVRLTEATFLTTQFEYRKSFADASDNAQIGLGLLFDLGRSDYDASFWDADGDGVSDASDACPQLAGSVQLGGCPDSDNDGIGDAEDPCPLYYGSEADGGCPDSDRDGIPDPEDACPDLRGIASEAGCPLPDADGDGTGDAQDECPLVFGRLRGCPDADADGLADAEDACPLESGPKSAGGCPDVDDDGVPDAEDPCPELFGKTDGCPDRDRDGVYDDEDRCPNVAGDPSSGGCPEIMSLERGGHAGAIPDVRFADGYKTLDSLAQQRLDRLAGILQRYPTYSLEIIGHADFEEPVPDRTDLSDHRAAECRDYLEAAGVDAERMSIDGYGAGKPLVRQGTAAERERNRRVEFNLITE